MHFEVIQDLINYIQYEFCMYICDDDFLINSTLLKCVEFLQKNSDYTSVGGKSLICNLNSSYKKILEIQKYQVNSLEQPSSIERFQHLSRNYEVVAYSLSRTKDFIERWPIDPTFYEKGIVVEVHPCFCAAVQGKIKVLEDLFVIRTNHERRILLPDYEENTKSEYWVSSINFSIQHLALLASQLDKIEKTNSEQLCEGIWQEYLDILNANYQKKVALNKGGGKFLNAFKKEALRLARFIYKDFKIQKIEEFLTKQNELALYKNLEEILARKSYSRL